MSININEKGKNDLQVVLKATTSLKPYKNNARTHSAKQIQQIANSIQEFGFTNPVLVDENDRIIAGHGRVLAAEKLGMKEVPTICIRNLTEVQIRAYIIADNKIAANAGWDENLLAIELRYISELKFDLDLIGFETEEIDSILDGNNCDPADESPEPKKGPAVTKVGDVWEMGAHRLICGDSLSEEIHQRLMEGKKAHAVITDPPYNVRVNGHVCGLGKVKHQEFAMASGEMSDAEFQNFLTTALDKAIKSSTDGSLHYVFMDWRHIGDLLQIGRGLYTELKNICVWNKDNGGMGALYRSKHELVAVFKHGTKPHINNIELGKHGRYRTNVWDYAGVNSLRKGRMEDLAMHPTVKPVALLADAIKDCTKHNQLVLDPFAGSGSTLIAAEKTGRAARCIEIDPHYCDVIVRRWQTLTGKEARNPASNQTFNYIAGGDHE